MKTNLLLRIGLRRHPKRRLYVSGYFGEKTGFTVMELLVVLFVVATVTSIVVPTILIMYSSQ